MKKYLLLLSAFLLAACNSGEVPLSEAVVDPTVEEVATTVGETSPTDVSDIDHVELLQKLVLDVSSLEEGQAILNEIADTGDTRFVAGLIDVIRYQRPLSGEINKILIDLTGTGEEFRDWHDWVEWAGKHPEIETFDNYAEWKSSLFTLIDPNFTRFVYPNVNVDPDSRLEEIVWGGVRVDGIPALDNPTMIDPAEADYLVSEERVFGVSINGDTRAYPARFLDWHEMFNDVVGGEPVSLAY